MDCLALPKGWRREEIMRRSGLSAGKIDVYYYSPNGRKFRTKPQLARYLGESVDLTTFDYRTGKINPMLLRKSKRQKGSQFDYSRGIKGDASLLPPIRQTASIFKQPVTLVRTQQEGKTRHDLKHGSQDKPKQLFWEKRLQHLKASGMEMEALDSFELPVHMKVVGPDMTQDTALRSISTALHIHSQPIVGQLDTKNGLEKNPSAFINPEQPLVANLSVSDDDIRRQENFVDLARKRLQDALNELD